MKWSQFFFLVAAVYLAQHMSEPIATKSALLAFVAGLLWAYNERRK